MQNKELMIGFIIFLAIFLVVGHMPMLFARNNSGTGSNDSLINNTNSDDEDNVNETEEEDEDELNDSDDEDDEDEERDRNRTRIRERTREILREGNCTIKIEKEIRIEDGRRKEEIKRKIECEDGTEAEIKIKIENRTEQGRFREKIKYEFEGDELEVEAEDEIDLEEETNGTEYKLKAKLRNGNFTDIKIMPDVASEIALERLKALNFTVQLRERIHNNVPRVVYNIEADKQGRFLGVFKIAMKTNAEIDPETGEVLDVNVPWWAFLIAQIDETQTGTNEGNETENETGTNDTGNNTNNSG